MRVSQQYVHNESPIELDNDLRWQVYVSALPLGGVEKRNFEGIPESVFAKVEVDGDDRMRILSNLNRFSPRTKGHIKRLCDDERSVAENLFGLALCLYSSSDFGSENVLPKIARREFVSSPWWWSVSPYIMQSLMMDGFPAEVVFKAIVKWGDFAKRDLDRLPGLEEEIAYFNVQTLVLSHDSNHVSHLYASALARHVISSVDCFREFRSKADRSASI